MSTYKPDSSRTKQGEGFERYTNEALKRDLRVSDIGIMSVNENLKRIFGETLDKQFKAQPGLIAMTDSAYGDVIITRHEQDIIRISYKSTSGSTITLSDSHLKNFCDDEDGKNFVIFAVVKEEDGVPVGEYGMLPASVVKKQFDKFGKDTKEPGIKFIGIQHLHNADGCVRGWKFLVSLLTMWLSPPNQHRHDQENE